MFQSPVFESGGIKSRTPNAFLFGIIRWETVYLTNGCFSDPTSLDTSNSAEAVDADVPMLSDSTQNPKTPEHRTCVSSKKKKEKERKKLERAQATVAKMLCAVQNGLYEPYWHRFPHHGPCETLSLLFPPLATSSHLAPLYLLSMEPLISFLGRTSSFDFLLPSLSPMLLAHFKSWHLLLIRAFKLSHSTPFRHLTNRIPRFSRVGIFYSSEFSSCHTRLLSVTWQIAYHACVPF